MANKLRDGDKLPTMQVQTVAHGSLTLPSDLKGEWKILLFYRGGW